MNFDFVDFLAVLSCTISAVFAVRMIKDIISVRKQQRIALYQQNQEKMSEYKKILIATYWLEHERQKNKGEHFDDETIYLNRAQTIRTKTSFFSFVNE